MGGVFINYRTADNPLGAAGIHMALVERFGKDKVFRDCESVEPGVHYPSLIRDRLRDSDVVVVIIGPQWLTMKDTATGQRLLDREEDWVRREIAWAREWHLGIVPVLLKDTPDSATQPPEQALPRDIRFLALIQSLEISQRRFSRDTARLVDRLLELVPTLESPGTQVTGRTRRQPTTREANNGAANDESALRSLPLSAFFGLVNALEAVPCVQAENTRAALVDQLRSTIGGAIPYHPQRRVHVINILRTCFHYEGGMAELLAVITGIEGEDSLPLRNLVATVTGLFPQFG